MKKLMTVILTLVLLTCSTTPAFAVPNEPTLEDYRAIASRILEEYQVAEFTKYQLFNIPDMTLEEYEAYIKNIALTNAYGLGLIETEDVSEQIQLFGGISPHVIFLRKTYDESKYFNQYFKVHATYEVVTPDGTNDPPWTENARDMYGFVTALGSTIGYTYQQYSAYATYNSDGTFTCKATGHWHRTGGGVDTDMGDIILTVTFGKNHL
ncbi:MAG: hypothetical protein K1V97_00260 [Lachnospiraceae bacterium]